MNHLTSIETRQRNSLIRDAVFAAFVLLGVLLSASTVATVAAAASTQSIAAR